MKTRIQVILNFLCLTLAVGHVSARPVSWPSLQELWAQADVVAVIRPVSTTNAADQLTSAGPNDGPRDPKDYQALNTRCEVLLVMKPAPDLLGWPTNDLTLLHFRYAPNVPQFNGAMFIYFEPSPAEHPFKGGPGDRTYLAFLKRSPDGRFVPVTGHYDSEPSFRIMETPLGGAMKYQRDDNLRARQANEPGLGGATRRSAGTNNPAPGATGSPH